MKVVKGLELIGKGLGGALAGGLGADYRDLSYRRNYREAKRKAQEEKDQEAKKEAKEQEAKAKKAKRDAAAQEKLNNANKPKGFNPVDVSKQNLKIKGNELKRLTIENKYREALIKKELLDLEDRLSETIKQNFDKSALKEQVREQSPSAPAQKNYRELKTSLKTINKNVLETKFLAMNIIYAIKKLEGVGNNSASASSSGPGIFESLKKMGQNTLGAGKNLLKGGSFKNLLKGGAILGGATLLGKSAINAAMPITEEQENYHSTWNTLKRLLTWDYGSKSKKSKPGPKLIQAPRSQQNIGVSAPSLSPTERILLEVGRRSILGTPSMVPGAFLGGSSTSPAPGIFTPQNSSGTAGRVSGNVRRMGGPTEQAPVSQRQIPGAPSWAGGFNMSPTNPTFNSPQLFNNNPNNLKPGTFGAPSWVGGFNTGSTNNNNTPANMTPREMAVLNMISKREGSTHPDIIFGDRGNTPGTSKYSYVLGGKKLSEMTINEVIAAQRQLTQATAADGIAGGRGTSAMGSGQFVRATLIANLKKLGIPESEWGKVKFDKDLQRRVTLQNFRDTVGDPNGDPSKWNTQRLGQQWESFDTNKGKSPLTQAEINSVNSASNTRNPVTGGTLRSPSTISPTQLPSMITNPALGSVPNTRNGTIRGPSSNAPTPSFVTPNVSENTTGKIRNKPLQADVRGAISYAAAQAGVQAEVFSGGQDAPGPGARRTGSSRHDHGNAGDVRFTIIENGKKRYLNANNPEDMKRFYEIAKHARAAGMTGIGMGPGYMGGSAMHIGKGGNMVWGAGGRSVNAPAWLKQAFDEGSKMKPVNPLAYASGTNVGQMSEQTRLGPGSGNPLIKGGRQDGPVPGGSSPGVSPLTPDAARRLANPNLVNPMIPKGPVSPFDSNTIVRNQGMGGTPILPSNLTNGYNTGSLSMMKQLPPSGLNTAPSVSPKNYVAPKQEMVMPKPQVPVPNSPFGNTPRQTEAPKEPQSQSQAKAGFKGLSYTNPDSAYIMPAGLGI